MRLPTKLALALTALGLLIWGVVWASGEIKHRIVVVTKGVDCADFHFSRAEWNSQPGPERFRNGPRTHQAIGLSECDLLLGRTKLSIREMLGPPPPDLRPLQHDRASPQRESSQREWGYREWDYIVGGEGDHLVLAVKFDRHGRVRRVEIY